MTETQKIQPGSTAAEAWGEVEFALSRTNTPLAWLLRHAHELSDHVALRFEGNSTTYRELADEVRHIASVLADNGVGRGDRVLLLSPNRPEFLHVTLASWYLGAVLVPVNFRLSAGEVAYLVGNSEPSAVVASDRLMPVARAAMDEAGMGGTGVPLWPLEAGTEHGASLSEEEAGPAVPPAVTQAGDDAAIMYTSGTTGRPKGAVLTHGNFSSNAMRTARAWMIDETDIVMIASPLFHIAAMCAWLGHFNMGATALIMPSAAFDATTILDAMEAEKVTTTFMVPAQWQDLCDEPRVGDRDLHLRFMSWGAAPATAALLRRMLDTFPKAGITAAFGQTETTASGVSLSAADSFRKVGSVGKAIHSFSVSVVDPMMNPVAPGEVGEIVYRGPGVMSRYWRDEAATAEAFRGGWFHSGDLVRVDDEGFLYVVDRIKDMIISGGENIYCAEVENVVADHPKVAQVAVVGRKDEKWGEVPVAVIIPMDPSTAPTLEEIRAFCDSRLARYKHPREVVIRTDYPRSGTGKILKNVLRDEI
ncbi:MAG: AMP-binding protein [Dermatophilus congolensis]|nr:AMP-binding protein [Dermatophilus congolensis]